MISSSMNWRYYEDIEVGEERKSKSIIITEKEIIDFAEKYDPQWFHSDPEASKESSFKGCLLYTSPSPRDGLLSRMPSSA